MKKAALRCPPFFGGVIAFFLCAACDVLTLAQPSPSAAVLSPVQCAPPEVEAAPVPLPSFTLNPGVWNRSCDHSDGPLIQNRMVFLPPARPGAEMAQLKITQIMESRQVGQTCLAEMRFFAQRVKELDLLPLDPLPLQVEVCAVNLVSDLAPSLQDLQATIQSVILGRAYGQELPGEDAIEGPELVETPMPLGAVMPEQWPPACDAPLAALLIEDFAFAGKVQITMSRQAWARLQSRSHPTLFGLSLRVEDPSAPGL